MDIISKMSTAENWIDQIEPAARPASACFATCAAISQAVSLKRLADALEKQNDLTAQLWLHQGKQETGPK